MSRGNQQNDCEDTREVESMRKLFVGGINKEGTTDETLEKCFSQFGTIVDHVVMKDKNNGQSRGFAFVTFAESAGVERAFQGRPIMLDGREVDIKRAMPREFNTSSQQAKTTRLFVGGVRGCTPEELQEYIESRHPKEYGTCTKIDFLKMKDGSDKGIGFIDVSSPEFADRLCISEQRFSLPNSRRVEIKKAQPKEGGGDQGGFRGGRGGDQGGNRGGRGGYSGNQGSYGGNQGGYGGNQSYGNNQGSYGGNQGSYGGNQGSYGGNQGGYGGNSGYTGQQTSGGYNQGYQQPSSGYSSGGYGQSSGGYGQSSGGYGQSSGGYGSY